MDAIAEARRILDKIPVPMLDSDLTVVPLGILRELVARAELAGAVTPGPSARQVMLERMEKIKAEITKQP